MSLRHDTQLASDVCSHCGATYPVRRGSLYRNGSATGLYLAGLHGCHEEPIVALGLAVPSRGQDEAPVVATLQVWATNDNVEMSFIDPHSSPWQSHTYLGRMLGADEARGDNYRDLFIELADYLLRNDPYMQEYLQRANGPTSN